MVAPRLHIGAWGRRRDRERVARHAGDLPASGRGPRAAPITGPITRTDVGKIASSGFPLWESIETMQLRNRRITFAYGDLSHQLAAVLAGSQDRATWDANWCTFATWSSRTIGTCIDAEPEHGLIQHTVRTLPSWLRHGLSSLAERLLRRGHGAIYRTLAVGNRLVFLEVATAASSFVACFGGADASGPGDFERYWAEMRRFLGGLRHLDPSWVATPAPDPSILEAGMRAYFDALGEDDAKAKAELVLLGNLLVGAYEQTRVDTYLRATLSVDTEGQLDDLVRGRPRGPAAAVKEALLAPASALYARFSTRFFLVLEVPVPGGTVDLHVGRPVPPLGSDDRLRFPTVLQHIESPELQAVLTRYDLSGRRDARTRATDWARFSDRMNYITALFRSRQRDPELFTDPWTPAEADCLALGRLPP